MAISLGHAIRAGLATARSRPALRFTRAGVGLVLCVAGTIGALDIGVSRLLASRRGSLAAVTRAVRLSPEDPSAFQARAADLLKRGEINLAIEDLRQAITLRSGDYKLWAQLGAALDRSGESTQALAALAEAERLAPSYASTHWDRGTLLLKVGRRDEAFEEFREATLNRPDLFINALNLAWEEYGVDCPAIERAVGARNAHERLILATFFIRISKPAEGISLVRQIDNLSKDDRRALVAELLKARSFAEAYMLWAEGSGRVSANQPPGTVIDGSFESSEILDDGSFGWRVKKLPATKVSIEKSEGHDGFNCLRIDWADNPPTSDEIISQLVIVEPNARYKLNFSARAQNLITGGAPIIDVIDVSQQDEQSLGPSASLPLHSTGWVDRSVEFITTDATRAVRIALRRENCGQSLCPIFGSLWLDDFSLQRSGVRPSTAAGKAFRQPSF